MGYRPRMNSSELHTFGLLAVVVFVFFVGPQLFSVPTVEVGEAGEVDGISYTLDNVEVKGDKVVRNGEDIHAVGKWLYADVEVKNISDEDAVLNLHSGLSPSKSDLLAKSSVDVDLTKEINDGLDITDLELGAGESVDITLAYDWGGDSLPSKVTMMNEGDDKVFLVTE